MVNKYQDLGPSYQLHVDVQAKGLDELIAMLSAANGKGAEIVKAAIGKVVTYVQSKVQDRTPVGVSGNLRASVKTDVSVDMAGSSFNAEGHVFTNSDYAVYVEEGTRPHFPPLEPLIIWVERKLGAKGAEALIIARAIRWKIGHYGTEAVKMFQQGLDESSAYIDKIFEQSADELVRFIASGGEPA